MNNRKARRANQSGSSKLLRGVARGIKAGKAISAMTDAVESEVRKHPTHAAPAFIEEIRLTLAAFMAIDLGKCGLSEAARAVGMFSESVLSSIGRAGPDDLASVRTIGTALHDGVQTIERLVASRKPATAAA